MRRSRRGDPGDEQTAWRVDAQSGILLRADDPGGSTALTALELDVELDEALFALPPDIPPLSHPPDVDAGDLDRVVASVPRAWA